MTTMDFGLRKKYRHFVQWCGELDLKKETGKNKTASAFVIFVDAHKEELGSDDSDGSEFCITTTCKEHTQVPTMHPIVTWIILFISLSVPLHKKANFNELKFLINDNKDALINKTGYF